MNTPGELFEQHIGPAITGELVKKINAVYVFDIDGPNGGVWRLDLKDNPGIVEGDRSNADITISINESNFVEMVMGKLNPQIALAAGKLKIEGNSALMLKILKVLNIY